VNPPADIEARLDRDYGPCDTDRRHIFVLSATVQTPRFQSMLARAVGSDWRLSGSFRATSGRPFSVHTGVDRALTGAPAVQRADQVLDNPYGAKTRDNWLNPAAFALPALGTFGNSPRNAYYGMGTRVVDLSLVRAFRFATSHRIEARVEAFNAFNWFRPAAPGTPVVPVPLSGAGAANNTTAPVVNISNPNFGRYLAADEPRIMQFAVKYQF
jgi:hypothetical protein